MAHTCPDCGSLCRCGGDIDDIDFGEDSEGADNCICCLGREEDEDEFYFDDDEGVA
jgi:hypothetical protein